MADVWHFFSKVAGVSHSNRDGVSRQLILSHCCPMERLEIKEEPKNPYDPNATGLWRQNGEQLGYLPARLAAEVKRDSELQGCAYGFFLKEITGGCGDKEMLGGNLLVLVAGPTASNEDAQRYLNELVATDPEFAEIRDATRRAKEFQAQRVAWEAERAAARAAKRQRRADRRRRIVAWLREGLLTLVGWLRVAARAYNRGIGRLLGPDRGPLYRTTWWVPTVPLAIGIGLLIGLLLLRLARLILGL
jgi:hypothetical protein